MISPDGGNINPAPSSFSNTNIPLTDEFQALVAY